MRLPHVMPVRTITRTRPPTLSRRLLRHELSRRAFLRGAAGATGAAVGASVLGGFPALAAPPGTGEPKPIPGGIELGGTTFHVFLPGSGAEPSTITDFNGFSSVAVVQGTWAATGVPEGGIASGVWESDMRFMKGLFVGSDGGQRQGTFVFT